jgi:hypothetical protein
MAPLRTARGPPRTASEPPVKKPAMIAFQGSSFCLFAEVLDYALWVGWMMEYRGWCSAERLDAPDAFDGAIKCREEAAPYPKVAS